MRLFEWGKNLCFKLEACLVASRVGKRVTFEFPDDIKIKVACTSEQEAEELFSRYKREYKEEA